MPSDGTLVASFILPTCAGRCGCTLDALLIHDGPVLKRDSIEPRGTEVRGQKTIQVWKGGAVRRGCEERL